MTGLVDPMDWFYEQMPQLRTFDTAIDRAETARRAQANREDLDRLPTSYVMNVEETGRLEEMGMLPGALYAITEGAPGIFHVLRVGPVGPEGDR